MDWCGDDHSGQTEEQQAGQPPHGPWGSRPGKVHSCPFVKFVEWMVWFAGIRSVMNGGMVLPH
jgi:hypothetical protein